LSDHFNIKILASLERESFSLAYSLAEALDASSATVLNRLHHAPGIIKSSPRLDPVPIDIGTAASDGGKMLRASFCAGGYPASPFRHNVRGDESWFYLKSQHTSQWSASRGEMLQKVNSAIGTAKFIQTALWGVGGFQVLDLIESHC
jgi:hypothetical protein